MPAKDAACPQPQHAELARKVEELQERLDEETKVRPGRGSSLQPPCARQRCWGSGQGASPQPLVPPAGVSLPSPPRQLRQKLELTRDPARSGTARALEARLQEAEEESQRLRAALEKKGQELQRSLQE